MSSCAPPPPSPLFSFPREHPLRREVAALEGNGRGRDRVRDSGPPGRSGETQDDHALLFLILSFSLFFLFRGERVVMGIRLQGRRATRGISPSLPLLSFFFPFLVESRPAVENVSARTYSCGGRRFPLLPLFFFRERDDRLLPDG